MMFSLAACILTFAPLPDGPCESGTLVPMCEHAQGFGQCKTAEVQQLCPETCAACALVAGQCNLHGDGAPADYEKPLPAGSSVRAGICSSCAKSSEQPCCFNYDSDGNEVTADGDPLMGCRRKSSLRRSLGDGQSFICRESSSYTCNNWNSRG